MAGTEVRHARCAVVHVGDERRPPLDRGRALCGFAHRRVLDGERLSAEPRAAMAARAKATRPRPWASTRCRVSAASASSRTRPRGAARAWPSSVSTTRSIFATACSSTSRRASCAASPVDLAMGYVNVIWQGDANDWALRCLAHAAAPPFVVNVTGRETLAVRASRDEGSARCSAARPIFTGTEAPDALLSNAIARALDSSASRRSRTDALLECVASWVRAGSRCSASRRTSKSARAPFEHARRARASRARARDPRASARAHAVAHARRAAPARAHSLLRGCRRRRHRGGRAHDAVPDSRSASRPARARARARGGGGDRCASRRAAPIRAHRRRVRRHEAGARRSAARARSRLRRRTREPRRSARRVRAALLEHCRDDRSGAPALRILSAARGRRARAPLRVLARLRGDSAGRRDQDRSLQSLPDARRAARRGRFWALRTSRSTRGTTTRSCSISSRPFLRSATSARAPRIVGGLLGQWSVWTHRAVEMLDELRERARRGDDSTRDGSRARPRSRTRTAHSSTCGTPSPAALPASTRFCVGSGCSTAFGASTRTKGSQPDSSRRSIALLRVHPELTDDEFVAANVDAWLR